MNMPDLPFSARPSAATARAGDSHRLAADGLWHSFGDAGVLRDVSLSLAPGEILCLVGPSGCGKSTLLRLLAGLERVQRGSIALDGKVIADASRHVLPEKRGVGMVFQDFALFPHLSLLDNVAFGLAGRRHSAARGRWRCWRGSAWPSARRTRRMRCPAASSSASPWPARWRRSHG